MRVFHFLNREFGLKDIRERRLKISRVLELNDPFEFLGVELSNRSYRRALQKVKENLSQKNGLICFADDWSNPVLWGHYADKHRGVCLGFDVPDENLGRVNYVEARIDWPTALTETLARQLLFTKFSHWSYEQEYRAYVNLDKPEAGLYYKEFGNRLALRQVIVGCSSSISRAELGSALGDLSAQVQVFKARPAFKSFRVVKNQNPSLWA